MSQDFVGFRRRRCHVLAKLGIKSGWISRQNQSHGFLASLFVLARIVARHATAIDTTINLDSKALTIQFKTTCLFASAPHVLNFIAV